MTTEKTEIEEDSPQVLTPDDSIDQLITALFPPSKKAKYKVEIHFGPSRTEHGEFRGAIKVWLSGATMGGNVDESVCLCPRCFGPIDPDRLGVYHQDDNGRPCKEYRGGVCMGCDKLTPAGGFLDLYTHDHEIPEWVDLLVKYFRALDGDVDFYFKRYRQSLTLETYHRMAKPKSAAVIDRSLTAMVNKEHVMYPLWRIIQDTQHGRSLRSALKAFLKS